MTITGTVILVLFFSSINCNLEYEYDNHVAPLFQDAILMALIVDGQYPLYYESVIEDSSKPKLTKYEKKEAADSRIRLIKKKTSSSNE